MDSKQPDKPTDEVVVPTPASSSKSDALTPDNSNPTQPQPSKADCKRHDKKKTHSKKSKKSKKNAVAGSSDSSGNDESGSDTDTSDSSDDDKAKRKAKKRRAARKGRKTRTKSKRSKHVETSDSDSESDESDESDASDDSAEEERTRRRRKGKKKTRRSRRSEESEDDENDSEALEDEYDENARLRQEITALKLAALQSRGSGRAARYRGRSSRNAINDDEAGSPRKSKSSKKKKKAKRGSTMEFKRVDQLWDSSIHDYKLTESAEVQEDQFDEYVFTVRRRFDWENKYKNTVVDVKSKLLRDALQTVMTDVKGVSLVEDQPCVDPNMLFLYLEELREYAKKTLKSKVKSEKKKKVQKRLKTMRSECKLLLSYLDEDYADTKKTLYPMLEAGNITFDLLWALFKPNTLAYTATYGSVEDPRCFKVDYATKESSLMRGEWYNIEGRYLEYDGKSYGLGDFEVDIDAFKGPRKITSLSTYPLKYHKDPEGLKKQLIERGKRFVSLEGMNYRFHKGLAFMKKKRTVAKVNINGRIMIDPAIFRRINPNYPISLLKPKDPEDDFFPPGESDDDCSCCGDGEKSDDDAGDGGNEEHAPRETKYKVVFDKDDNAVIVEVPIDSEGRELPVEKLDVLPEGADPKAKHEFSEEELLIASPVVFGFAFSEKLWLEFSLSGVRDIEWNEGAFQSLVLPENQKSIVKALVESHKFHAAKTIDDVVQGKGKGLVAVLHGPPGTGKTLTAEGIAELLRCPLYMVSAGELGTDPRVLESELQKILDIAHSWGAVLLLDEADVFLEKREVHDIHRNALVSIFLRLLEYFQGILFLTTNRVETFDDAFQSRIHIALRYGELTGRAKKAVWKMFLERVQAMEGVQSIDWTDEDFEVLSRKQLNGRQIKNAVRTAQALAVNNNEKLSMEHIRRVLQVAESFDQDLKGGTGYVDAMRSYT